MMTVNTPTPADLQARERECRAELAALEEATGFPVRGAYSVGDRCVDVGVACVSLADLRKLMQLRALPDRETTARALHDAVTAKARAERANVARWEEVSSFHRNGFLVMADAVLALFGQEGQR